MTMIMENEAYLIAKQISNQVEIVNQYSESEYLIAASINNQWPYTSNEFIEVKVVSIKEFESMDELLRNSQQFRLTQIIVDNDKDQPIFLQELMRNEKIYPYLTKEFDSNELGYDYHVKVFEIDYEKFN